MYLFFSKNHINLTENSFELNFILWALSTISLHGKISLNFTIKFYVSLSIKPPK